MEIVIDIGNTNVVLGFYKNGEWIHLLRFVTKQDDEARLFYDLRIRELILDLEFSIDNIEGIYLSSVVPILTQPISQVITALFETHVNVIRPSTFSKTKILIDDPSEIGTDLVANAVAAVTKHQKSCVIVDFGTALTFTTVTKDFEILGVAIAPGLKTAMSALHSKTAQLPEVPSVLPKSVIGKNTTHAIQSGVLWGYIGLVKEMLKRIETELGLSLLPIATGGLSSVLHPLKEIFYEVDTNLTLDGVRIIGRQGVS